MFLNNPFKLLYFFFNVTTIIVIDTFITPSVRFKINENVLNFILANNNLYNFFINSSDNFCLWLFLFLLLHLFFLFFPLLLFPFVSPHMRRNNPFALQALGQKQGRTATFACAFISATAKARAKAQANEKWEGWSREMRRLKQRIEKWEMRNENWEMRNENWEMRIEKWELRNEKWDLWFSMSQAQATGEGEAGEANVRIKKSKN